MKKFWKRPATPEVPSVPLTVSLALADLATVPAPPQELVRDFAAETGRQILIDDTSSARLGSLDRGSATDAIHLPNRASDAIREEACLHQLGHLMIGHDECLLGHSPLVGDARLQELDASMFAGLIMARYREVKRATGSKNPKPGKVTAAYVFGMLDDRWPANVRSSS